MRRLAGAPSSANCIYFMRNNAVGRSAIGTRGLLLSPSSTTRNNTFMLVLTNSCYAMGAAHILVEDILYECTRSRISI